MDTKTLMKSLRTLFSNENKIEKKYTKVWIFSGHDSLIRSTSRSSSRYTVHVQYDNPITCKFDEINKLEKLIHEKIKGASERVRKVDVHYFNDGYYHCGEEEILVYDDLYDTA